MDCEAVALSDAVLVNTSRGAIVDEDAPVDTLRGRRLAAAGAGHVQPTAAGCRTGSG
jgi:phosphoglycerate dehydrogenase-like enzyme